MAVPSLKMSNGYSVPMIGFGTFFGLLEDCNEETVQKCIESAIDVGYRHIDTALAYQTEPVVGRAIKNKIADGTVTREDIFVTSKLPFTCHEPEDVKPTVQESLQNLCLDYIDLYLIHTPFAIVKPTDGSAPDPTTEDGVQLSTTNDHVKTWKEMEQCVRAGQIRAIGVSNFNSKQIQRILDNCEVKPAMNQVEIHTYFSNERLVRYCWDRGVSITAYTPLGQPHSYWRPEGWVTPLANPVLKDIAAKYNKSPAQIALKYQLQRNIVIAVKATSPKHQKENIELFDFEMSPEDMAAVKALDKNQRAGAYPAFMKHKDYPFSEQF